jgi:hypothetical protein
MKMRAAPVCLIQAHPPERNAPGARSWSDKTAAGATEESGQEAHWRRHYSKAPQGQDDLLRLKGAVAQALIGTTLSIAAAGELLQ